MDITDERAAQLKAAAIAARRASRPAWRNEHHDRQAREREARRQSLEYRQAQPTAPTKRCTGCRQSLPLETFRVRRKTGVREARCNPCLSAEARAAYYKRIGQPNTGGARGTLNTARQRRASERVARLAAILTGADARVRINSEEDWAMANSELRKLWDQSGEKECASCGSLVPPTAMLPPGPGNFYPGKCRSCVASEFREERLRVVGSFPDGPPLIPLKDGSSVTIGQLANRHRERERSFRIKRWSDRPCLSAF